MGTKAEDAVLDAAKCCSERWGLAKVTIDDIASEAGVSRATVYRMFPGGKDVLFDALRVRETEEFLIGLRDHVEGSTSLEELLVRTVVHATRELRADEHFALMLASEPGEVAVELSIEGLPRIIRIASVFLCPLVEPYLPRPDAARLVELLSRLVISYFLAPSMHVDLGDPDSARPFLRAFILPAFESSLRS
jgi:AcrR family transcriptional regulator